MIKQDKGEFSLVAESEVQVLIEAAVIKKEINEYFRKTGITEFKVRLAEKYVDDNYESGCVDSDELAKIIHKDDLMNALDGKCIEKTGEDIPEIVKDIVSMIKDEFGDDVEVIPLGTIKVKGRKESKVDKNGQA